MYQKRENEIYELAFDYATRVFFNFENLPEKMEIKVEIVEQLLTFLEEETEFSDSFSLKNWIKNTNFNLKKMKKEYRKVKFSVTPNLSICIQNRVEIKMRFLEIYTKTLDNFLELENKYNSILTKAINKDSNALGETHLNII